MSESSGLTIRQHLRENVNLPVEFVIADEHRGQVQFSATSAAANQHSVSGIAVDLSSGGMGLHLGQFIPRMCEGSVRVFEANAPGDATDGSPIREVTFEHRVKVRRTIMVDHEPVYSVGVSFIDPAPDTERRINELLLSSSPRGDSSAAGETADA